MKEENLKIAIYCRVGSENQLAINEQEEKIKNYCKLLNYDIKKVYKDNGYSGRDNNRPAYKSMLKDLKSEKFNAILTISTDRITRNISELEEFFNDIKNHNCTFKSIKDKIDLDTASGKLFARMIKIICNFGVDLDNE